jgi:valyl-tRNA synthetase
LNDSVPDAYRGLDRFEARERVVAHLDALGLLDGVDTHTMNVPRGDRSGAILEPFLTDQWYVRTKPLAGPAIEAVESGAIRFIPENWSKTYFEWMNNIEDWCISRQLWWGHRIPAWYDADGNIYVAKSEAAVRQKHALGDDIELQQDNDVLDTWFSSSLWPFSSMGWPENTQALKTFYPTSVLVTGFDIIFFWVARMIMMGLKFMDDVPFREVYIHGLIRDQDGQKMSKSKGNVLDPLDIVDGIDLDDLLKKNTDGLMQPRLMAQIERATRKAFPDGIAPYGADALRMTLATLATTGRDVSLDLGRVEGYRNFCNKLWNAAHYVFSHTEDDSDGDIELTVADRWIQSRLNETVTTVHKSIGDYRLDLTAQALYEFIWHEFCDWYLELTKPIIMNPETSRARLRGTRRTLADTLGAILKLLHPIMPFITEELWLEYCERNHIPRKSVMLQTLPEKDDFATDTEADDEIDWVKAFVVGVRQIRGELDINPGKKLLVKLAESSATDRRRLDKLGAYVKSLARLESIELIEDDATVTAAAAALVGQMRIVVPLAGLLDLEAEVQRLTKKRGRVEADLDTCRAKLANSQFLSNAPKEIVADQRGRAAELTLRLEQLDGQLERLRAAE